jgi:hypothetical protein
MAQIRQYGFPNNLANSHSTDVHSKWADRTTTSQSAHPLSAPDKLKPPKLINVMASRRCRVLTVNQLGTFPEKVAPFQYLVWLHSQGVVVQNVRPKKMNQVTNIASTPACPLPAKLRSDPIHQTPNSTGGRSTIGPARHPPLAPPAHHTL